MRPGGQLLVAAVLIGTGAGPAVAQTWSLDAYWGRASYDQLAANVQVDNPTVALRFDGLKQEWLHLSIGPALGGDGASWLAAGAGQAPTYFAGRWSLGLEMAGHGYFYRDAALGSGGAGGTLDALPFVGLRLPVAQLRLHSGWRHYATSFSGVVESRGMQDSGLRLTVGDAALSAGLEGRYVRAQEGNYPYLGGSGLAQLGDVTLWGSGGYWLSADLPEASWGGGAGFRVTPDVQVFASVRRDGSHPLYWNSARTTFSVGMSWAFARSAAPAAEREAGVSVEPDGRVIFRLPVREVRRAPYVAGDFTDWQPRPMYRQGEYWVAELRPGRGVYEYAFRRQDGSWFVPKWVAGRRDDGMGGHVAYVVVP